MIDKNLVKTLLRVVQSPPEQVGFATSMALLKFVKESGIGAQQGSKILFTETQKERLRSWLEADNVSPETPIDAWDNLGRVASLAIGPNEKWAGEAVRAQRIAFKALEGRPLHAHDKPIYLPPLANLEWTSAKAIESLRHDAVVVIENWEVFERVDDLQLIMSHVSPNPLILWRGGASNASVGAAMRFLEAFGRPVWSAPDYDPEGLAIAARLPHLAGVLAPADDTLRKLLDASRRDGSYSQQLPGALTTLEQTSHADVMRLWAIVRASGSALPQERLCLKS